MNNLDQAINLKVKVTNLLDQSIQGSIYAFSPMQRVLAVQVANPKRPNSETIKLINTAFIKSIQVLQHNKKNPKPMEPSRSKVDLVQLEADINSAIAAANQTSDTSKQHANSGVSKKNTKLSPLAHKVFERLSERIGKENVQVQGNESMVLFNEVLVAKPYALTKISNSKKSQNSKHIETVRAALREVWMGSDKLKRGG